ncbi:MAG: DUF1080 domain-containing protein [Planctomycetes bacterium]|nr:DUF1080 domain-containing protein [Planctomycetota bacterium]
MALRSRSISAVLLASLVAGCRSVPPPEPARDAADPTPPVTLFDGVSLAGWAPSHFGGDGEVTVEDGRLVLGVGGPLTGVTWVGGELPRDGYELQLDAARVEGGDFFCALTFPVGASAASLVLGGWGGSVTGISNLDGADASENETTRYLYYETGRRYAVRLRVADGRIRAWLDGEPIVDADLTGRAVGIRPEVAPSLPLGVASYATRASIGPITLLRLPTGA